MAEAYRNLCAVGARPLATTDNLNFGNPEKPEIMGQFVGAIKGIGAACLALDMPIVSGNVSLYNETDGKGILPTPTIGAVGILTSLDELIAGQPVEGDLAVVIGETRGHLGQSALLAEAFGIEAGDAPPVDLAAERRHGEFVRANRKLVRAATDLADGGLALAAFEMAEARRPGLALDGGRSAARSLARIRRAIWWRWPLATLPRCRPRPRLQVCRSAVVGQFGGSKVDASAPRCAPLADLSQRYRSAFAKAVG